jgi:CRP-like cAMP-binding protein
MSAHEQRFAKGEHIFKEGTVGDRAYEIQMGEVLIYKDGPNGMIPLAKLGPGDMFGEMFIMIESRIRNASAVALNEVMVAVHFEEDLRQDLEDLSPRQRKLMKGLFRKLNNTSNELVQHKALLDGPKSVPEEHPDPMKENVLHDRVTLQKGH